jgi:hypothetical protein
VKYIIDGLTVCLSLTRVFDRDGSTQGLILHFNDSRYRSQFIILYIAKAENDLLKKINFSSTLPLSDNVTYESRGFFKETNFFFHGGGRGLIVVEQNSMQRGMNPYKVTVEHY